MCASHELDNIHLLQRVRATQRVQQVNFVTKQQESVNAYLKYKEENVTLVLLFITGSRTARDANATHIPRLVKDLMPLYYSLLCMKFLT